MLGNTLRPHLSACGTKLSDQMYLYRKELEQALNLSVSFAITLHCAQFLPRILSEFPWFGNCSAQGNFLHSRSIMCTKPLNSYYSSVHEVPHSNFHIDFRAPLYRMFPRSP